MNKKETAAYIEAGVDCQMEAMDYLPAFLQETDMETKRSLAYFAAFMFERGYKLGKKVAKS